MQKDEADVQCTVEGLNSWIPDLLSQQQPLVDISNGLSATDEMTENIKATKNRGEETRKRFLKASPYEYMVIYTVSKMQQQRRLQEQINFLFHHNL